MLTDLRFAVRQFLRRPGFTVVAILTLAIGIGANTAIFSLVNGVLLAPLPLADGDRLVWLAGRSEQGFDISVSIPNYRSWAELTRTLEATGARRTVTFNLTGGDRPERLVGSQVLGDFFGVAGRAPVLGRTLRPEETDRGAARLAVLSHALWQRRFDADPAVLGRTLVLNGDAFTVVGVMPADFFFAPDVDLWVPMGVDATLPWENRGNSPGMYAIGRPRSGVTHAQVVADFERVGQAVTADSGWPGTPTVTPLREILIGDVQPAILVLFGAVGFVLLIACINLANLLVARGDTRRREVAVRAALGAGRGRLVRQLLTESVLTALVGGALGVGLASAGSALLLAELPLPAAVAARIGIDTPVLLFTLAISVATGLLFGVVPALRVSRVSLGETLKDGGRGVSGGGHGAVRGVLVVGEIALALVLLAGAGLMIQSFARLRAVDPGFRTDGVVTMRIALPDAEYVDSRAWWQFFERLLERVDRLPGVQAAAVNNGIPLGSGGTESGAIPDSRPAQVDSFASCLYQAVSGSYFDTLGIPLRRGRTFDAGDRDTAPLVAIVDETMAEEFWPGEDPVGRRVAFEFAGERDAPEPIWREVVGVVGHVRHYELRASSRVQIYVPYTQPPTWFANRRWAMALFVRAEGDPGALVAPVRDAFAALDPNLPLYDIQTMDEILATEMRTDRLLGGVLGVFALAALLLASVGIYGVMSYLATQRTREIGIRIALGAGADEVVRLMLGGALRLVVLGLVIGLTAAAALSRSLSAVLYEVGAGDPVTFGGIALLLALAALVASYLPARRAARLDPIVALRDG